MRRRASLAAAAATALALLGGTLPAVGVTPSSAVAAPVPDPTAGDVPEDRGPVPAFEPAVSEAPGEGYAPDRVLVRFTDRTTASQQRSALSGTGSSPDGAVARTGFTVVDVGDRDPADVAAELADDPRVADVQVDHVRRATAWTDDEYVDYTWPYLDLMRLPRAWDESTGEGVVVAVLDTGVDAGHPDLAGAVLPGIDLVHGDADAADDNGHGTMVAGIVAANGGNGIGNVGAAPHARVLPIKVLDAEGTGTDSVIAEGIDHATTHGARVINVSLGGGADSPVLLAAVQRAVAAGAVVVAAAGNTGTEDPQYPAAYADEVDGFLAVSATDDDGSVAGFSSWGDWVSIAAPGSAIVSTAFGDYADADGTSFAAPFVSGAAAMVLAQGSRLSATDVEGRLVRSARDAGPRGTDPFYGHGVLDAAAAVGVTPALPLDRVVGDGGADDVPGRATPLAREGTGSAVAYGGFEAEGDVDWHRFEAAASGRYDVSLVQRSGATAWDADVQLEVRDGQGHLLGSTTTASSGTASTVPVDGTGPWLIGVRATRPLVHAARYSVQVTWRTPQPPEVELAFGAPEPLSGSYSGMDLAVSDVTGDGRADAVVSERVLVPNPDGTAGVAPAVGLHLGTAGDTFGTGGSVRLGTEHGLQPDVLLADLEGDGTSEALAVTDTDVWLVRGSGGVLTTALLATQADARGRVTVGDLDGDGDVDLMIPTTSGVLVLAGDGAGGLTARTVPVWTEAAAPAVAFVDVDRDGRLDIVRQGGQVLVQSLDGTFAAGHAEPALADVTMPEHARVVEVTGDGVPDLLHAFGTGVALLPGLDAGGFGPAVTVRSSMGWYPSLTATDVDGDGRQDVVLTTERTSVSISLQRPDGTFLEPQGPGRLGDSVAGVVVHDHDGDGDGDVVAGAWGQGIVLARQVGAGAVPGPGAWVLGTTPDAHASGIGVRPRITLTSGQDLVPASLTERTVRLLDGTTGDAVAATRDYDAVTRTVSVTPSDDLVPGHHYEVVMTGVAATTGDLMVTSSRTWFTVGAGGARFTPVDPYRVLDTRTGTGASGRAVPGVPVELDLADDVPADATAVVLNVVGVSPSAVGNVRVYPTPGTGQPVPASSNINVVPGVDQPNLVTVALSAAGRVSLLTEGPTAHLVADIAGYYSPGGATGFVPRDPVRMLDTRTGLGASTGPVRGGRTLDLQVTGRDGVPRDASAVVLNLTATGVTAPTYVGAFPTPAASEDQTPPLVSNLNLLPGRDQANLVTVRVGDGGRVRLHAPFGSLHLIADLAGYYAPTGDHGFVPLAPARVADTRTGAGVRPGVAPGRTPVDVAVAGRAGVPAGAAAAVLNVVGVGPRGDTHVRAFPTTVPASLPTVSMLNLVAGRDEANLGLVRLGDAGRVTFYAGSADLHLVVDVFGYFRRDAA